MSNIRGIPGEINVSGNIYKGVETESATVKVNNFTKEISANVKDNYLHEKLETKQYTFNLTKLKEVLSI